MKKVGKITYIADSKFAIAETTEFLILGSEVLVCNEINTGGENAFKIPKGKLKVVMLQDENKYLLSVVSKDKAEDSSDNQSLARTLSIFASLFPNNAGEVEIPTGELADYSAQLDATGRENIKINPKVSVGNEIYF